MWFPFKQQYFLERRFPNYPLFSRPGYMFSMLAYFCNTYNYMLKFVESHGRLKNKNNKHQSGWHHYILHTCSAVSCGLIQTGRLTVHARITVCRGIGTHRAIATRLTFASVFSLLSRGGVDCAVPTYGTEKHWLVQYKNRHTVLNSKDNFYSSRHFFGVISSFS